jgi:Ca-activated chloride channel homolog
LAETGGGSFYRAFTPGSLEAIFRSIDSLESMEERVRIHVRNIPVYRWFVFIGLACVFLDLFLRKILFREVL